MKTQSYFFGTITILLVVSAVGYAFYASSHVGEPKIPRAVVHSFEECLLAGNPVMESYPRQCKADGVNFTETIVTPIAPLPSPEAETSTTSTSMITVSSPTPNTKVKSPLVVSGSARGNWYFEASFPILLLDANGNTLAQTPAHAKGDWMTTDFVPFDATLAWSTTTSATGTLVLRRDNPSGLPANDAEIRIPISF